jgi:hypothetical protein
VSYISNVHVKYKGCSIKNEDDDFSLYVSVVAMSAKFDFKYMMMEAV